MEHITIRSMQAGEQTQLATLLATGYNDDLFFKWVVPADDARPSIVAAYYSVYLNAPGAEVYVATKSDGTRLGTAVWLPHDVDPKIYGEIEAVGGSFAPNFTAVADASHENEPKNTAFSQLVGFVVDSSARGQGIGSKLLQTHLTHTDASGIPTYLEASTPFHGGGVYGKFHYAPFGSLLHFSPTATLYPLWRPVGGLQ